MAAMENGTAEAVAAAYDELAAALRQYPQWEKSNGLHASRFTAPPGTSGRAYTAPWATIWTNPETIGWSVWPAGENAREVGRGLVGTYADALKAADDRLEWWLALVAENPCVAKRLARWS